jgi:hypothetical protein
MTSDHSVWHITAWHNTHCIFVCQTHQQSGSSAGKLTAAAAAAVI